MITRAHEAKQKKPTLDPAVLADPVKFTRMCWPHIRIYEKQEDILYSLRDNVETFSHAANEMGKDFISAIGVLWFFASRRPARVITSSSGETQLKNILWSEMKARIKDSRFAFPFNSSTLHITRTLPDGTQCPLSYVLGHVTKTVENFQGHHLPHDIPRVMCLFDEASGIGDEFYEAAQSWAHRILVIGNPLSTTNFFYRMCKKGDQEDPSNPNGGLLRKVIHIDAVESPNYRYGEALRKRGVEGPYESIIPGVCSHADYLRRTVNWDKVKRTMRLDGRFYEGAEALMFPPDRLDAAEEIYRQSCPRWGETRNFRPRTRKYMGVDTGAGRDLTVWTIIDEHGIVFQHAVPTPDTAAITKMTLALRKEFNIKDRDIAFDSGGGGKQIVDHLRDKGYRRIRSVAFGSAPAPDVRKRVKSKDAKQEVKDDQQSYKNKRVQMYDMAAQLFNEDLTPDGFAVPEDLNIMREELAVLPIWYDGDGKQYLPPKDDPPKRSLSSHTTDVITIKKLIGRSPDRADSFVLAVYAMKAPVDKLTLGGMSTDAAA